MIQQGYPSQAVPFVNANGCVAPAWYSFLVSLFQRTGGPVGVDTKVLYGQVQSVSTTVENITQSISFDGIEEGRFAALQMAVAGLVSQVAPDPALAVLLFGDAR